MNFRQLKDLTASWLDDLNFGYFTETQVSVWTNNAQKEVQKRLLKAGKNYYTKCVQTTLVVNQSDYVIPDDFKKLHRLEVIVSGTPPNESKSPLSAITANQQDYIASGSGTPQAYYFKKNRLVVLPFPNATLTMRLLYSYEVTDMSADSDVPDVPDGYHELIALLACEDGFLKDGRVNELLQKKLASFQKDMDDDAQERNQDMPRTIVETGASFDGGFDW